MNQATLRRPVTLAGIGLHTGRTVRVRIGPAGPDRGLVFRRVDLPGRPEVAARTENVANINFAINLRSGRAMVGTTEHFLAALFAAGIDNALVELDGPEMPILDGSAAPIFRALRKAGRLVQAAARTEIFFTRPLVHCHGSRAVLVRPGQGIIISYHVHYAHPLIGSQYRSFRLTPAAFGRAIAPARTFGWAEQAARERRAGLIKGASIKNAVYFDRSGLRNPEGLRFADEPVRHKILDLLAVLALLPGRVVAGHFYAVKSGHALDVALAHGIVKAIRLRRAPTGYARGDSIKT